MRINRMLALWCVFITALAATQLLADSFTFNVVPGNGVVAGPPGAVIGWGYSITNDSQSNWLVTTAINADSFLNGTATSLFDFPAIAPDQTTTVPFDFNLGLGLYELAWDNGAPIGFSNSGAFTLSAGFWSGDPLHGGQFQAAAPDQSVHFAATVSSVPELPTIMLLFSAVIVTALGKSMVRKLG